VVKLFPPIGLLAKEPIELLIRIHSSRILPVAGSCAKASLWLQYDCPQPGRRM